MQVYAQNHRGGYTISVYKTSKRHGDKKAEVSCLGGLPIHLCPNFLTNLDDAITGFESVVPDYRAPSRYTSSGV